MSTLPGTRLDHGRPQALRDHISHTPSCSWRTSQVLLPPRRKSWGVITRSAHEQCCLPGRGRPRLHKASCNIAGKGKQPICGAEYHRKKVNSLSVEQNGRGVPMQPSLLNCLRQPDVDRRAEQEHLSHLLCNAWPLAGRSLFETYDALMTPPRDDKQLKSWLCPLDTWHIKPCSKRHVLAWEKAITALDSHRAQMLIQCLHLPYCY